MYMVLSFANDSDNINKHFCKNVQKKGKLKKKQYRKKNKLNEKQYYKSEI